MFPFGRHNDLSRKWGTDCRSDHICNLKSLHPLRNGCVGAFGVYLQTWKSFLDCAWTWRPAFSVCSAAPRCWPSTRTRPACRLAFCRGLRCRSPGLRTTVRPCWARPRGLTTTANSWCPSWAAWNETPFRTGRWYAHRIRDACHASIGLEMFLRTEINVPLTHNNNNNNNST